MRRFSFASHMDSVKPDKTESTVNSLKISLRIFRIGVSLFTSCNDVKEHTMNVNLKEIAGNWDKGIVLDKHSKSSVVTGQNEYGHNVYDTIRTDVGEALFQLKYRSDWNQVQPLAQCLYEKAYPLFDKVGLIVPMAASNVRARQPVTEVAQALAHLAGVPCFTTMLLKAAGGVSLKNLNTKEEKVAAIADSFSCEKVIEIAGRLNVLVIDDLYHTGASMEAACAALRGYNKINNIYVAALTWR